MHTQIKLKCRNCGLHFVLCTWEPEKRLPEQLYCPECGTQGIFLHWQEQVSEEIFQIVPGQAELIGISTGKK